MALCGTAAGYARHQKMQEDACSACLAAIQTYNRRFRPLKPKYLCAGGCGRTVRKARIEGGPSTCAECQARLKRAGPPTRQTKTRKQLHACTRCGAEWESTSRRPDLCRKCQWSDANAKSAAARAARRTGKTLAVIPPGTLCHLPDAHPVMRRLQKRWQDLRPEKALARRSPRVAGFCTWCDRPYVGVLVRGRTCSASCSAAANASARRTARGDFFIDKRRRLALYERDNWVCQLCKEPVDRDAHYLTIWAPSLDHIIPQSKGGGHGDDNLRLAHRWCNSVRGDDTFYTAADLVAT